MLNWGRWRGLVSVSCLLNWPCWYLRLKLFGAEWGSLSGSFYRRTALTYCCGFIVLGSGDAGQAKLELVSRAPNSTALFCYVPAGVTKCGRQPRSYFRGRRSNLHLPPAPLPTETQIHCSRESAWYLCDNGLHSRCPQSPHVCRCNPEMSQLIVAYWLPMKPSDSFWKSKSIWTNFLEVLCCTRRKVAGSSPKTLLDLFQFT
jgi:hypothetical protein